MHEDGRVETTEKVGRRPKFGVVMMGGTLAMERNENGHLVPAQNISKILSKISLPDRFDLPIELQSEVVNIDSTNLNPRYWEMAIRRIEDVQGQCDGILMPHGTDTMAYTASAIGLALNSRLKVPVVLTGSQIPFGESGSDAQSNVERGCLALERATADGSTEPMVFFDKEAYRGLTAFKINEADITAFDTASTPAIYRFNAFGINRNAQPRTSGDSRASREAISEIFQHPIEPKFSNEIIGLELKPGLTAEAVEWMAKYPGCRALLLKSFGAGNVPSSDDPGDALYNLIPVIKKIHDEMGKLVIVTSPFRGGNTATQVYETGVKAIEAGAIDAGRMTDEAAHAKASLLLGQDYFSKEGFAQDPHSRMATFKSLFKLDFAGETGKEFDFVPLLSK